MNSRKLRTVVIGFGKIGAGYADDPVMARHYQYATHAQVLRDHPRFRWDAVVDVSEAALDLARERWGVLVAAKTLDEVVEQCRPEVAVIATGPEFRIETVEALPDLRAVIVEKPLGLTETEARRFLELCREKQILVQVNLWRRGDSLFRELSQGLLQKLIGEPQWVFGVYGNGLMNNGTHMIDFVRMLLGDVEGAEAVGSAKRYAPGPLPGDVNVAFNLRMRTGVLAMMHPLDFAKYRENGLDLWGDRGRLTIMQEGLKVDFYPLVANRAMQGEREVASDQPQELSSTVGEALYHLYDNLADALIDGKPLLSPGDSALETMKVVHRVLNSIT